MKHIQKKVIFISGPKIGGTHEASIPYVTLYYTYMYIIELLTKFVGNIFVFMLLITVFHQTLYKHFQVFNNTSAWSNIGSQGIWKVSQGLSKTHATRRCSLYVYIDSATSPAKHTEVSSFCNKSWKQEFF